jgi:hypothetical protein
MKAFNAVLLIVTASAICPVQAQTVESGGTGDSSRHLLNENYLAPTGETVPRPGVSQGAATTDLDRRIEQKDNSLEQSICSNCN